MMLRRALPAGLVLALAPASLALAGPRPHDFLTPSGNISCTTPALGHRTGISCTVFSEDSAHGQKVWQMRSHGRARTFFLKANAASEGPVLAYGHSMHRAGVRCHSRRTGLTCRNRSQHGFFLSRESQRTF